jgi:hypothetical protein
VGKVKRECVTTISRNLNTGVDAVRGQVEMQLNGDRWTQAQKLFDVEKAAAIALFLFSEQKCITCPQSLHFDNLFGTFFMP